MTYAVKQYFQRTADGRDRLEQEWAALSFMEKSGIYNVPIPLISDSTKNIAVYSFLEGTRIESSSEHDINSVLNFLTRLKESSAEDLAESFDPASEACVAPSKLIDNIWKRLSRLKGISSDNPVIEKMQNYLEESLLPFFLESCEDALALIGQGDWEKDLDRVFLTLSPSDLGFHNALRNPAGGLFFLDFEYFGWDDPVKIISDFMLHPAMTLTMSQKEVFLSGMFELFKNDKSLSIRLKALFPLYRVKWCLILLNEFLKLDIERRQFASEKDIEIEEVQRRQLGKSERMLSNVDDNKLVIAFGKESS